MEKPPIFPKNIHTRVAMFALTALGVWPLELKGRPNLKKFYAVWSFFIYYYNFYYVCTQWIEAYNLIRARNINLLMRNVGLALLTAISIFRTAVTRGTLTQVLLKHIYETEEKILTYADEDVKKIYMKYAYFSQFANKFFLIVGYLTSIPFFLEPMGEEWSHPELYRPNNITGEIETRRILPLSAWYPYNTNHYYYITFWSQIFSAFVIEGFVVYTDSFLFSLMIFAVGQMKILQHILKNFQKYSKRTALELNLDKETASKATMRACLVLHKSIIQYVDELDHALRIIMLLDFMSCSLQMSVILFQIIMFEFGVLMLHAVEFLISMVIQMFLFYWNANEIIVESQGIANAIYYSEWYEDNEYVKKEMQIMMMRAQRPMTLSIGPFYPMSTDTAISILKATYSYGMLLRQSYIRRH